MASSSQAGSSNDLVVVETDPKGQYARYNKIIGQGEWKKVYLGLDMENGMEIAWSITLLTEEAQKRLINSKMLCTEGDLLKSLNHENIIKCYDSWIIDDEHNKVKAIHMITELFSSGNLLEYVNKHNLASVKAFKTIAIQILKGLHYLHTHNPRIVHRDIKCENIFVNGNTGTIKIGDFGIAMRVLEHQSSETPRFMALDNSQRSYNPLIDIYFFGMCMLQMVTRKAPYVLRAGKPAALIHVTDPEVKRFIEMCLADETPKAIDLLNDPFLASSSLGLRESVRRQMSRLFYWVALLCTRQPGQEQRGESENEAQRLLEEGQQREGEDTS